MQHSAPYSTSSNSLAKQAGQVEVKACLSGADSAQDSLALVQVAPTGVQGSLVAVCSSDKFDMAEDRQGVIESEQVNVAATMANTLSEDLKAQDLSQDKQACVAVIQGRGLEQEYTVVASTISNAMLTESKVPSYDTLQDLSCGGLSFAKEFTQDSLENVAATTYAQEEEERQAEEARIINILDRLVADEPTSSLAQDNQATSRVVLPTIVEEGLFKKLLAMQAQEVQASGQQVEGEAVLQQAQAILGVDIEQEAILVKPDEFASDSDHGVEQGTVSIWASQSGDTQNLVAKASMGQAKSQVEQESAQVDFYSGMRASEHSLQGKVRGVGASEAREHMMQDKSSATSFIAPLSSESADAGKMEAVVNNSYLSKVQYIQSSNINPSCQEGMQNDNNESNDVHDLLTHNNVSKVSHGSELHSSLLSNIAVDGLFVIGRAPELTAKAKQASAILHLLCIKCMARLCCSQLDLSQAKVMLSDSIMEYQDNFTRIVRVGEQWFIELLFNQHTYLSIPCSEHSAKVCRAFVLVLNLEPQLLSEFMVPELRDLSTGHYMSELEDIFKSIIKLNRLTYATQVQVDHRRDILLYPVQEVIEVIKNTAARFLYDNCQHNVEQLMANSRVAEARVQGQVSACKANVLDGKAQSGDIVTVVPASAEAQEHGVGHVESSVVWSGAIASSKQDNVTAKALSVSHGSMHALQAEDGITLSNKQEDNQSSLAVVRVTLPQDRGADLHLVTADNLAQAIDSNLEYVAKAEAEVEAYEHLAPSTTHKESSQTNLDLVNHTVALVPAKFEVAQEDVKTSQTGLDQTQVDLAPIQAVTSSVHTSVQDEISSVQAGLDTTHAGLESVRTDKELVQDSIAAVQGKVCAEQSEIGSLQDESTAVKAEASSAQDKVSSVQDETSSVQDKASATSASVKAEDKALEAANSQLNSSHVDIALERTELAESKDTNIIVVKDKLTCSKLDQPAQSNSTSQTDSGLYSEFIDYVDKLYINPEDSLWYSKGVNQNLDVADTIFTHTLSTSKQAHAQLAEHTDSNISEDSIWYGSISKSNKLDVADISRDIHDKAQDDLSANDADTGLPLKLLGSSAGSDSSPGPDSSIGTLTDSNFKTNASSKICASSHFDADVNFNSGIDSNFRVSLDTDNDKSDSKVADSKELDHKSSQQEVDHTKSNHNNMEACAVAPSLCSEVAKSVVSLDLSSLERNGCISGYNKAVTHASDAQDLVKPHESLKSHTKSQDEQADLGVGAVLVKELFGGAGSKFSLGPASWAEIDSGASTDIDLGANLVAGASADVDSEAELVSASGSGLDSGAGKDLGASADLESGLNASSSSSSSYSLSALSSLSSCATVVQDASVGSTLELDAVQALADSTVSGNEVLGNTELEHKTGDKSGHKEAIAKPDAKEASHKESDNTDLSDKALEDSDNKTVETSNDSVNPSSVSVSSEATVSPSVDSTSSTSSELTVSQILDREHSGSKSVLALEHRVSVSGLNEKATHELVAKDLVKPKEILEPHTEFNSKATSKLPDELSSSGAGAVLAKKLFDSAGSDSSSGSASSAGVYLNLGADFVPVSGTDTDLGACTDTESGLNKSISDATVAQVSGTCSNSDTVQVLVDSEISVSEVSGNEVSGNTELEHKTGDKDAHKESDNKDSSDKDSSDTALEVSGESVNPVPVSTSAEVAVSDNATSSSVDSTSSELTVSQILDRERSSSVSVSNEISGNTELEHKTGDKSAHKESDNKDSSDTALEVSGESVNPVPVSSSAEVDVSDNATSSSVDSTSSTSSELTVSQILDRERSSSVSVSNEISGNTELEHNTGDKVAHKESDNKDSSDKALEVSGESVNPVPVSTSAEVAVSDNAISSSVDSTSSTSSTSSELTVSQILDRERSGSVSALECSGSVSGFNKTAAYVSVAQDSKSNDGIVSHSSESLKSQSNESLKSQSSESLNLYGVATDKYAVDIDSHTDTHTANIEHSKQLLANLTKAGSLSTVSSNAIEGAQAKVERADFGQALKPDLKHAISNQEQSFAGGSSIYPAQTYTSHKDLYQTSASVKLSAANLACKGMPQVSIHELNFASLADGQLVEDKVDTAFTFCHGDGVVLHNDEQVSMIGRCAAFDRTVESKNFPFQGDCGASTTNIEHGTQEQYLPDSYCPVIKQDPLLDKSKPCSAVVNNDLALKHLVTVMTPNTVKALDKDFNIAYRILMSPSIVDSDKAEQDQAVMPTNSRSFSSTNSTNPAQGYTSHKDLYQTSASGDLSESTQAPNLYTKSNVENTNTRVEHDAIQVYKPAMLSQDASLVANITQATNINSIPKPITRTVANADNSLANAQVATSLVSTNYVNEQAVSSQPFNTQSASMQSSQKVNPTYAQAPAMETGQASAMGGEHAQVRESIQAPAIESGHKLACAQGQEMVNAQGQAQTNAHVLSHAQAQRQEQNHFQVLSQAIDIRQAQYSATEVKQAQTINQTVAQTQVEAHPNTKNKYINPTYAQAPAMGSAQASAMGGMHAQVRESAQAAAMVSVPALVRESVQASAMGGVHSQVRESIQTSAMGSVQAPAIESAQGQAQSVLAESIQSQTKGCTQSLYQHPSSIQSQAHNMSQAYGNGLAQTLLQKHSQVADSRQAQYSATEVKQAQVVNPALAQVTRIYQTQANSQYINPDYVGMQYTGSRKAKAQYINPTYTQALVGGGNQAQVAKVQPNAAVANSGTVQGSAWGDSRTDPMHGFAGGGSVGVDPRAKAMQVSAEVGSVGVKPRAKSMQVAAGVGSASLGSVYVGSAYVDSHTQATQGTQLRDSALTQVAHTQKLLAGTKPSSQAYKSHMQASMGQAKQAASAGAGAYIKTQSSSNVSMQDVLANKENGNVAEDETIKELKQIVHGFSNPYERQAFRALIEEFGLVIRQAFIDSDVTEIMLNTDGTVFIESNTQGMIEAGHLAHSAGQAIIRTLASLSGKELDLGYPILSSDIPRLNARFEGLLPPLTKAPVFSIRKHNHALFSLDKLQSMRMLSLSQKNLLLDAIKQHMSVIISGPTSSGKTSLLNSLLGEMSKMFPKERIITIEDTPELYIPNQNHLHMYTSERVDMSRLVRSSLRLRPDRLIVGEVRGPEALDLIDALATGHRGGITSVHAGSVKQSLDRLMLLVSRHPSAPRNIGATVAGAIDLVVQVQRDSYRHIAEIAQIQGFAHEAFVYQILDKNQEQLTKQTARCIHAIIGG